MIKIDDKFGLNDRYDIQKILGEGGMGTVFKAYDNILKEFVAIKTLNEKLSMDESVKNRFLNEAKICLTLTHSNIIRVRDVNIYDDIYYMVMEYIPGVELKEIMAEQSRDDIKELYLQIKPIFEALDYAHQFTVHRDIKPANIMVKDNKPYLMDFGISKALEDSELNNETIIGGMGTKKYISPEQAFNANDVDKKTDIYSMGVLFYELLTAKVVKNAAVEEAKKPSEFNDKIPSIVDDVILQMLEAKPARRQDSFKDILSILDSHFFNTKQIVQEVKKEVKTLSTSISSDISLENMVKVEAGNFLRGSGIESNIPIEKPRKAILLDEFYISKYCVTNKEYNEFLEDTDYAKPQNFDENLENKPNHPVVYVSYLDAKEYASYKNASLPSEAQWEKAAKGGKNFVYPWGKEFDATKANIARVKSNTSEVNSFEEGISVGGIYNMAGNIWEWCEDDFDENFYKSTNTQNPVSKNSSGVKVLRGGSFDFTNIGARTTFRFQADASTKENNIGIRLVYNV